MGVGVYVSVWMSVFKLNHIIIILFSIIIYIYIYIYIYMTDLSVWDFVIRMSLCGQMDCGNVSRELWTERGTRGHYEYYIKSQWELHRKGMTSSQSGKSVGFREQSSNAQRGELAVTPTSTQQSAQRQNYKGSEYVSS